TNCNIPSAACKTCAVTTKLVSPAYGPLVIDPQLSACDLNVVVCVALVSHDSSATGCGPRLQAKLVCEDQACGQCTKPEDAKAGGHAADTVVCATAATGAQGCQQYESQCFVGSAKRDAAVGLIMLFCG